MPYVIPRLLSICLLNSSDSPTVLKVCVSRYCAAEHRPESQRFTAVFIKMAGVFYTYMQS